MKKIDAEKIFFDKLTGFLLTGAEGSQGELIGWDSSRRACIHTFKHEYL